MYDCFEWLLCIRLQSSILPPLCGVAGDEGVVGASWIEAKSSPNNRGEECQKTFSMSSHVET